MPKRRLDPRLLAERSLPKTGPANAAGCITKCPACGETFTVLIEIREDEDRRAASARATKNSRRKAFRHFDRVHPGVTV